MQEYTNKIREISEKLLKEKKVDLVIGFRRGTLPMMNEPCIIRSPEEVGNLVWDSHCGINLATYLKGRKEKVGIIAKGCDSRNIVTHLIENQIERDRLTIIGIPCQGMIDKNEVTSLFKQELEEVKEEKGKVLVKVGGVEKSLDKDTVLQQNCRVCLHRNPVLYDELAAELVEEQKGNRQV